MAAELRDVLAAIKTAIETVNGSGVYTHNLSDGDRVVYGAEVDPARVPRVNIFDVAWSATHGARLGYYERVSNVSIIGYVGAADDSNGARLLAAADLLNDICRALESDRTLGGEVRDLIINSARAFDGAEWDLERLGAVELVLQVNWSMKTGT